MANIELIGGGAGNWAIGDYPSPAIKLTVDPSVPWGSTRESGVEVGAFSFPEDSIETAKEIVYSALYASFIKVTDDKGQPITANITSSHPHVVNFTTDGIAYWSDSVLEGLPQGFNYVSSWFRNDFAPVIYRVTATATAPGSREKVSIDASCRGQVWRAIWPTSYVPGSFAQVTHTFNEQFLNALPTFTKTIGQVFSSYGATMTRNPAFVGNGAIDTTPFATDAAGWVYSLISPRHVVGAYHVGPSVGGTIWWVGADGQRRSSVITRKVKVTGTTDVVVAYLQTPITDITPVSFPSHQTVASFPRLGNSPNNPFGGKVYGSGWLANNGHISPVLGFTDSYKVLYLRRNNHYNSHTQVSTPNSMHHLAWMSMGSDSGSFIPPLSYYGDLGPWTPQVISWYGGATGGDSGSPCFTVYNTKVVLHGHMYTVYGFEALSRNLTQLDAAMNATKDPGDSTVYSLLTV